MSDHLPLWVELAIDFSDEHLMHNLSDVAGERGESAQREDNIPYGPGGHVDPPRLGENRQEPETKEEAKPKRRRKRKEPRIPTKEKVGTARPDRRMTWGEAWRLFWYVASGEAEKVKALRKTQQQKAKPKRRSRRKRK